VEPEVEGGSRAHRSAKTPWAFLAVASAVGHGQPLPPILTNTDGDPVIPTTDDFDLVARRDEAARSSAKRASLELLVKEIERSDARLPADERIDVGRVRVALGLAGPA